MPETLFVVTEGEHFLTMLADGRVRRWKVDLVTGRPQEMDLWGKHVIPEKRDERPHSRACGITPHEHGLSCNPDCPTCHGAVTPLPPDIVRTV